MLSAKNVGFDRIVYDDSRLLDEPAFAREDARTKVRPGSVLLTIVGAIGRSAVVPDDAAPFCLQRSVAVLDPIAHLPRLLMYLLQAPRSQGWLSAEAKGTAQKGVYLGTLGRMQLPVPPIGEQQRIVAKLDAIFEKTRAAKTRLERLPALLEKLKRSILAAAFRGDLTKDWRAAHSNVEPARTLAERILQSCDPATVVSPGTTPSSRLPALQLPPTWSVTPTANVGHVQVGRRRAPEYVIGECHPYLRVANIKDDTISFDDLNEMIFTKDELSQYLLRPGDILLSEGQSLDRVGQSAMYRENQPAACYQATLNRFRSAKTASYLNTRSCTFDSACTPVYFGAQQASLRTSHISRKTNSDDYRSSSAQKRSNERSCSERAVRLAAWTPSSAARRKLLLA